MKKMLLLVVVSLFLLVGCSSANLDDVKANADRVWKSNGYQIEGYLGYQYSIFGARVWYTLKRIPDNGILYKGFIQKWGDEYHIYDTKAIDAIKPEGK